MTVRGGVAVGGLSIPAPAPALHAAALVLSGRLAPLRQAARNSHGGDRRRGGRRGGGGARQGRFTAEAEQLRGHALATAAEPATCSVLPAFGMTTVLLL